jgi:Carboxypeptidase regulatory-like domain/TonB dependent receptor
MRFCGCSQLPPSLRNFRWATGQVLSAVAMTLLVATFASAQLPTAVIRGVVHDAQGAVMPGATVTITHVDTGLVRVTTTNDSGVYRVGGLPSGTYTVTVEMQTFRKQQGEANLVLNQEGELNFTLAMGGLAEEVQVTAGTPIIETTKSEVSRTYTAQQIQDLPLPARNFLNLVFRAPGVTTGGTGLSQGIGASVNGQRARNVNYVVDGSDNNDHSVSTSRSPIIQDAVGEFRVVTTLFSAEIGRNTGAVLIGSTKSGANRFFGTVFEFYEDAEVLNARDNLETSRGLDDPALLRRDTYGGSFGGPLQRNKMFFFGAYQRRKLEQAGALASITSPTEEGRRLLRAIPGASATMLDLLDQYVPAPNAGNFRTLAVSGVPIPVGDFVANPPSSNDNNQVVTRIDRNLSNSDLVYGRYLYGKTDAKGSSNPPGFGNDTVFPTHNIVGTWNRVLTSSMLNELHFSYGRTRGSFPGSVNNPAGYNDIPTVNVTGLFSTGLATNIPQDRLEQVWQVTNNLSYLRSNHALKFGADVRRIDLEQFTPFDFRGTFTYQNLTGFVLNTPQQVLQAYGQADLPFKYWETFFYAQDDWKATPYLTLNLGLRYEFATAPEKFYSNVSNDTNNVAPRFGFAWDISKRGVMVVRGGYGIAYEQLFLNIPLLAGQQPPYQRRILDVGAAAAPYPSVPSDRPLNPLTLNILDIPDDTQNSYAQQWQLGIQRQFGETWAAEVAYVGSRGLKLIRQRVVNPVVCCPQQTITSVEGRPALLRHGDPLQTGQIANLENSSSSNYHAAQFSVDKRLRSGFSLTFAYTFSKFIDDASESLGTGAPSLQRPQDNFDLRAERALSSFDKPHRLSIGGSWELPWWKEQQHVLGYVLGGWQISGTYSFQSGQPFTIITGVDSNGDGDPANDRPHVGTGDRQTIDGYIFRPALSGGQGNLRRNSERGPRTNNIDAVLFKNFRIVRDHRLQFRIEAFNVANHRQFVLRTTPVERNLSSPGNFYKFTTSNGGNRSIVLGLKYIF